MLLFLVAIVLGSANAFAATPAPTAVVARARLVDYPETHPLVWSEFDKVHYPKYAEIIMIMNNWAAKWPDLVDVYTAGESFEGVSIWQMTLTNKKTGVAESKPAMFVGANRHSGEVTTRPAALEFAWRLLSGYGADPEITFLMDNFAYYVRPVENPDGSEMYLNTAQTNRSTVRPYDDDGDGLFDEDPGDDLDGDGFIRQMRQFVGKGNGDYAIDPNDSSGRLMVRVGAGRGDYTVMNEGIDNDGDGRINEDGIGGLDLHRNYPENWRPMKEATGMGYTQGGAGEYPLSEPEMRSMFLWMVTHANISIVQTMDTAVPMHLRPPSTSKSEESMFGEDLAYYKFFDEEGKKLSGYARAGDVYYDYSGGRGNPLFGHSPDFGYFQFGAIWYGDELWGRQDYVKDYNEDGKVDLLDQLWMNDNMEEIKGKLFQSWTSINHPKLGVVEVGGWNPKFWNQNPPAGSMLALAVDKQTAFNMLLAKSLPKLEVTGVALEKKPDGNTLLTVTIANTGFLPDALTQANLVKIVRQGFAKLQLGDGLTLAEGSPALQQSIGTFAGRLDKEGSVKKVSWLLSGTGEATLTVRSTRGGTVEKKINVFEI
jgi:hypothetical protein